MIKICAPKNVSEIHIEKQLRVQPTQNLYRYCVGFFAGLKVNGSVALTCFSFGSLCRRMPRLLLAQIDERTGVIL